MSCKVHGQFKSWSGIGDFTCLGRKGGGPQQTMMCRWEGGWGGWSRGVRRRGKIIDSSFRLLDGVLFEKTSLPRCTMVVVRADCDENKDIFDGLNGKHPDNSRSD